MDLPTGGLSYYKLVKDLVEKISKNSIRLAFIYSFVLVGT